MNVQTAIRADKAELLRQAREEAYSTPLKDFHPGAPRLFQNDTLWPWFERLRKEEPVHYCTNAPIEPYWSVHQIQRHHACRHQSRHLLVRRHARRHLDPRRAAGL